MKKNEDEKKKNSLFRSATTVIFISCESLILGNSKNFK